MRKNARLFAFRLFQIYIGLIVLSPVITSCRNAGASARYSEAIHAVFEKDNEMATIRNHACEDTTLAEAVRQYVADIDAMDFGRCPADFAEAFKRHRDAWANTIPFFTAYDSLRGEMHELFAAIESMGPDQRVQLKNVSQPIGDTWVEVEKIARMHGALPEE